MSNKGPTLILIRTANGNLFGAYIAVNLPNRPADGQPDVNVAPSGKSFMFSLINAYGTPFQMNLVDRTRAIRVGGGPSFGGEVVDESGKTIKFSNLMMFFNGAANTSRGMCCNPFDADVAYQLDELSFVGGRAPAGFSLDETTSAGSREFAAAEIEVYSI